MNGEPLDPNTIRELRRQLGETFAVPVDRIDVMCDRCPHPVALTGWRKHQLWHRRNDEIAQATVADVEAWLFGGAA